LRRGLLVAAGLGLLAACVSRESVDECAPTMPQAPANYGDPCDAPGAIATAKDQGCGYYECIDGGWFTRVGYPGCSSSLFERSESGEYCPRYCLADLEPETMLLDESCYFSSLADEGDGEISISRCDLVDGAWEIPSGETFCVGLATQDNLASGEAFQTCAEQGVNAAFVIVGDVLAAVPEGYELAVGCAFEMYPVAPCPLERFDAPPLEAGGCTSEG
jgi:hypothetical protein